MMLMIMMKSSFIICHNNSDVPERQSYLFASLILQR